MHIPLYFVTNCKECMVLPSATPLPMGCGLTASGDLHQPTEKWDIGPLLFDDSNTVKPTDNCLKKLHDLSRNGCILDFERPVSNFHRYIIRLMNEWKVFPLWLPEPFSQYAPPDAVVMISQALPHNSWKQFCISQQQKFPNRWALELQPMRWEKKLPFAQNKRELYLNEAACMCRIRGNTVHYYDTKQSLMKKLHIAEECGCRGAVALWSEWENK